MLIFGLLRYILAVKSISKYDSGDNISMKLMGECPTQAINDTVPVGTYTGCSFSRMTSEWTHGAVFQVTNSTLELVKCVFDRCTVAKNGGAIYVTLGNINILSTEFRKCTSYDRSAGGGGAIHVTDVTNLTVDQ